MVQIVLRTCYTRPDCNTGRFSTSTGAGQNSESTENVTSHCTRRVLPVTNGKTLYINNLPEKMGNWDEPTLLTGVLIPFISSSGQPCSGYALSSFLCCKMLYRGVSMLSFNLLVAKV